MSIDAANTTTPASANFEKLKAKLRELFELDKADLDFGIYRVLRARHKEIAEFLDKHLEKTVREALRSHGSLHQAQVGEDLRKAEQAAKDAGINPEQSPRVLELREKLKAGNDLDALADEVYSHLYTFFSRYYQEGDFLGLQRSTVHGREKYMIPYNGEEVKLVWANMDQYYIKSSELLRDYVFQVAPGAGTLLEAATTERYTIHLKLVEADTEKDNRKPNGKGIRVFALDDEKPFVENTPDTLSVHFRYREHTVERNLQDKLNADTEKTLADNLPAKWKAVLFAPDPTYQGKDKKDTRTILQKHLRSYTAKYQFDYFIHKDLGGFLRRELDFYIKNEVMYLDDIEESGAPKAEEYLSKIRALRRCAVPVIGMLEQLENFQKKLWLKKKFVVETRYCMTLDHVPEKLFPEIAANTAQREEWVKLYAINEIKKDLTQPGYSEPLTVEFLKTNPYLVLDTCHFSRDFRLRLLASVENLDEMLDGVCLQSDSFHALHLLQDRYKAQFSCVYADPPYNTSEETFIYKNIYKHSSWLTMISQQTALCRSVISDNGAFLITIDDEELYRLKNTVDQIFGSDRYLGTIVVQSNPRGRGINSYYATSHEYLLAFAPIPANVKIVDQPLTGEQAEAYRHGEGEEAYRLLPFRRSGGLSTPDERPNSEFSLYYSISRKRIVATGGPRELPYPAEYQTKTALLIDDAGVISEVDPTRLDSDGDVVKIMPVDTSKERRVWRWSDREKILRAALNGDFVVSTVTDNYTVQLKDWIKAGRKPKTIWTDSRYDASSHGTNLLIEMFGTRGLFGYPKSIFSTRDALHTIVGNWNDAICLDYFAGSGTTGHALINLNREDEGTRRYVLAEMGEHFDTVLVPRLKKAVYSSVWKDGKPENRNTGLSHAFKIVRLEGYEDALNNLRLKRTPEQDAALQAAPEKARDQYLLSYFLDVESAGSASLLDLDQFRDPFAYKLKIATSSAGETVDTTIDLVETFNWLLGLKVKHIDAQKGILTVIGEKRAGGRTLVIWRTLSDDPIADNKALESFLGKIKVNPADTEFDYIYINGSHTLTDPHNKIHLIEEAFQRLMFDTPDFGMEA